MTTLTAIGLDHEGSKKLIQQLNELLANYQVLYMNVRGLHWNVAGTNFFELHLKFEEQYNNLLLKVDEIAERILTLGGQPWHSFSQYLSHSTLQEVTQQSDGKQGLQHIVSSYGILIQQQRQIMSIAADCSDEGTTALMSDYIREQEKLIWMFSAYLR